MTQNPILEENNLLIYTNNDGSIHVETLIKDETVWLNQDQMAILFGKTKSTINEHIKNIYEEGELVESETLHKFGISEFQQKATNYYNLDVIISVGYRVKSRQGTQFRKRATQRIHEYIIKGFTMDDTRLAQGGHKARYFEELLQRIRDIRSSERNFYQKVTDIYATSIDYKKDDELTKQFFATVQNKIHYAIHGHTAAELIHQRADADNILDYTANHMNICNYALPEKTKEAKDIILKNSPEEITFDTLALRNWNGKHEFEVGLSK